MKYSTTLVFCIAAALSLSSCVTTNQPAEAGPLSVKLLTPEELKRYAVPPENPFMEHVAALIKSKNRFLAFSISGRADAAELGLGTVSIISKETEAAHKIMYKQNMIDYWANYPAGDKQDRKIKAVIQRLVPASASIPLKDGVADSIVVVMVSSELELSAWKIVLQSGQEMLEYSGDITFGPNKWKFSLY